MIPLIVSMTLRQLLGQRRTLLLGLLAMLPMLIAVVFRFASDASQEPREFAIEGIRDLVVNLVLPLAALIFGTAALGQEFEDRTAPFLFAKPIARWRIGVAKVLAAWIGTAAVVGASVIGTGLIVLVGHEMDLIIPAFVVAVTLGALAYTTLFVCLSVLFERALIIGLTYVFIWEALITNLAPGAAYVSVRAYTLGIARDLANAPSPAFTTQLSGPAPWVALAVIVVVAGAFGLRRLDSLELARRS